MSFVLNKFRSTDFTKYTDISTTLQINNHTYLIRVCVCHYIRHGLLYFISMLCACPSVKAHLELDANLDAIIEPNVIYYGIC